MSEFGDLRDSAAFYDPNVMDRDHSYVPGFSDMKRDIGVQMVEVKHGRRSPKDVGKLPVNLRWARAQNVAGAPDSTKQFGHSRKGYRLVNKQDVGQAWLTEVPPGCQIGADGTIRNGDTVLMVCDQGTAARNELVKRRATEERVKGAEGAFASMIESSRGVSKGAAPYTEVKPGEPAKK